MTVASAIRSAIPEAADRETEPPGGALRPRIDPALRAELEVGGFDYPWRLAPGLSVPVADRAARHAAATLEAMLEEALRDALAAGSAARGALILGCGEARLAHCLLGWGANHVVGVELRPRERRRAELLRAHFGVPPSALEIRAEVGGRQGQVSVPGGHRGSRADAVVLLHNPSTEECWADLLVAATSAASGLLAVDADRPRLRAAAAAAREAGFEVRPAPLPLEAERRYIARERYVVLAQAERA